MLKTEITFMSFYRRLRRRSAPPWGRTRTPRCVVGRRAVRGWRASVAGACPRCIESVFGPRGRSARRPAEGQKWLFGRLRRRVGPLMRDRPVRAGERDRPRRPGELEGHRALTSRGLSGRWVSVRARPAGVGLSKFGRWPRGVGGGGVGRRLNSRLTYSVLNPY